MVGLSEWWEDPPKDQVREVLEEAEDEAEDGEDDDGGGRPRKKGGGWVRCAADYAQLLLVRAPYLWF